MSQKKPGTGILSKALRGLGPLLALLVVIGVFAVAEQFQERPGNFISYDNYLNVSIKTVSVALAACGMTVIIVSGGIDLSAGTAMALCATMVAWSLREDLGTLVRFGDTADRAIVRRAADAKQLAKAKTEEERSSLEEQIQKHDQWIAYLQEHSPPYSSLTPILSVCVGLLTGAATGLLNGFLVAKLRVVPFIVTLGTMTIYLGIAKIVANEITVRPHPSQIPEWLASLRSKSNLILWMPISVWLTLFVAVAIAVILRYTVFGRHVYAIGSNESTARLCGIPVERRKILVYTLSGILIGIGGVFQFSRLSSGNPTEGGDAALKMIAAVVIGGGSLSGGRGTIVGTLCGAAIVEVIPSGCTQVGSQFGMSNSIQDVVLGLIIIAAVAIDQWRQRKARGGG